MQLKFFALFLTRKIPSVIRNITLVLSLKRGYQQDGKASTPIIKIDPRTENQDIHRATGRTEADITRKKSTYFGADFRNLL